MPGKPEFLVPRSGDALTDRRTAGTLPRAAMHSNLIGVAALFSGVALVMHILAGISLRLGLVVTGALLVAAIVLQSRSGTSKRRTALRQTTIGGVVAGLLATAAYDSSKVALSQLSDSSFDPIGAIHAFGTLLVGADAPAELIAFAGFAFHALNGVSFGVAFYFLFARSAQTWRRAIALGLGWAAVLEGFQLALYPGWLDARAFREFAQVSAFAHAVYGAVLGGATRLAR